MDGDRCGGQHSGKGQRPPRIQQGAEIDLGAEMDEEQRDGKAFADPDQLLGDPARLTEQGDHHSDDKPGDQDRRAEPAGRSTRR